MAVGLFLAVRVGANVIRLYRLGSQVVAAENQLDSAKLKNAELKQKLGDAQTPEFLEKEVRERLGYAREGETVVIISPDLASYRPTATDSGAVEPNWKQWWKLYFGS
jgi:cell division protein FtsB